MAIGVTTIGILNAGAKGRSTLSLLLVSRLKLGLIHRRISSCDIGFRLRVLCRAALPSMPWIFKVMSSTSDCDLDHCSQSALAAAERADVSRADIYGIRRTCRSEVVARGWSFLRVGSGCDAVLCGRRIFCEQYDDNVLAPYGRRTQRLETIVHNLGLALGGRPAAAFATRLMVPVSNDTLLRVVRRHIAEPTGELSIIGIDDFAFRRGQTYGTMICDLERRRPVRLLPDRALDTSRAWLAEHPSISVVARDRGGGYGEAIARALPHAE